MNRRRIDKRQRRAALFRTGRAEFAEVNVAEVEQLRRAALQLARATENQPTAKGLRDAALHWVAATNKVLGKRSTE